MIDKSKNGTNVINTPQKLLINFNFDQISNGTYVNTKTRQPFFLRSLHRPFSSGVLPFRYTTVCCQLQLILSSKWVSKTCGILTPVNTELVHEHGNYIFILHCVEVEIFMQHVEQFGNVVLSYCFWVLIGVKALCGDAMTCNLK